MGGCHARPRASEQPVPDALDIPHLDAPVMRRMSTAKRTSATPVTWFENSTFVAQEDAVFPMRPESLLLFDSTAGDGSDAAEPSHGHGPIGHAVVADHIAAFLLSTVSSNNTPMPPTSLTSASAERVAQTSAISDATHVFLDDLHALMADSSEKDGRGEEGFLIKLDDDTMNGESSADDDIDTWLAGLSLGATASTTHHMREEATHQSQPVSTTTTIDRPPIAGDAIEAEAKGRSTDEAAPRNTSTATVQSSAEVVGVVVVGVAKTTARPVSLYGFSIEDE